MDSGREKKAHVSEEAALSSLDQQVQQYNQAEHDAQNSVYNEIFGMPSEDRIIVDCHPGAGSRATVALDREDYQKIIELASDLGWD